MNCMPHIRVFLTQILQIKRECERSNNVIIHVKMHVADFMQCAFMYAWRCKKAYTYFHADLESQIPLLPAQ